MYNAQGFNQNNQLPVPYNGIDPSTQNPNLPQGNDRVPQLQLSQWMMQNQQIGLYAIGLFRSMAQSTVNKSPVHFAAYNLLAQNHFNNQLYQQWCDIVCVFVEFLIRVKGYQPQDGINKGCQRVYEALLGITFNQYQGQLQPVTPQQFIGGLQTALAIYTSVTTDVQNFRNGVVTQGSPGQLPAINLSGHYSQNGHGSQGGHNIAAFQTSGNGPASGSPSFSYPNNNQGTTSSVDSAFYDDAVASRPLLPVEEVSTDSMYSHDYFGTPLPQEQKKMQTFDQQQIPQPEYEQTDLPSPTSVDDVVMDPTYYTRAGFKLDINRPYDVIYSPGGIETRPAQLSGWEITIGDDMPWRQVVDPDRFCLFHVRFPDGVVKEKFVEWTPAMDYLRHEADAELRRKAYRPQGEVVASAVPISTVGGDAAKEAEVFQLIKDGHLKRSTCPPIVLEQTFTGTTELEVEALVREELQNLMEVTFDKDVPMPSVEYRSSFLHPLAISKECYDQLTMLLKQEDLAQVALGLRELVTQSILPVRYFNFINGRLTDAVNDVLKDGLTLNVDITDFAEDYAQLEDYLTNKKGEQFTTVLRGAARSVMNKSMFLMDGHTTDEPDDVTHYIVDNYINFQLGWSLDDLATLNIRDGKAVLISASAHPTILESLRGMISRANEREDFVAGTMRLVTSDGFYLEVIKGRLVQKATLLKLVK